jgi:hypothetical protein
MESEMNNYDEFPDVPPYMLDGGHGLLYHA